MYIFNLLRDIIIYIYSVYTKLFERYIEAINTSYVKVLYSSQFLAVSSPNLALAFVAWL